MKAVFQRYPLSILTKVLTDLRLRSYVQLSGCVVIFLQGRSYVLPEVWIRPPFGGKGRKVTGSLESHANGFRYQNPKGEQLDIMYRCQGLVLCLKVIYHGEFYMSLSIVCKCSAAFTWCLRHTEVNTCSSNHCLAQIASLMLPALHGRGCLTIRTSAFSLRWSFICLTASCLTYSAHIATFGLSQILLSHIVTPTQEHQARLLSASRERDDHAGAFPPA